MTPKSVRVRSAGIWELQERQHGVVTRGQLLEAGLSGDAIRHRLDRGRLHRLLPGVYAVGRPGVTTKGRWMGAVLACGSKSLLSHRSAAALCGLIRPRPGPVEVVIPAHLAKRYQGIRAYRRASSEADRSGEPADLRDHSDLLRWRLVDDIPVTAPAVILVDLASCIPTGQLEAAINEADHLDLIDPEALRGALDALPRRPGARRLRVLLDTTTHALTTTVLEQRFLPLAREAGLPTPETQARPRGHRVDFLWPDLGLVVETDSLRYHRTAFKQAGDKRRDNEHVAAGLVTLRFTHGQVSYEPGYVRAQLRNVAGLLRRRREARTGT